MKISAYVLRWGHPSRNTAGRLIRMRRGCLDGWLSSARSLPIVVNHGYAFADQRDQRPAVLAKPAGTWTHFEADDVGLLATGQLDASALGDTVARHIRTGELLACSFHASLTQTTRGGTLHGEYVDDVIRAELHEAGPTFEPGDPGALIVAADGQLLRTAVPYTAGRRGAPALADLLRGGAIALRTAPTLDRADLGAIRTTTWPGDGRSLGSVSGDGKTLEGYAAVFNSPTRINGWEGEFDEEIAPGAFLRSLTQRTPVLQFDHGLDTRTGSVPIGAFEEIREDTRGLYVRARLFDNPVVEPIRQAIAGGAIRGMSFRFQVPPDGDEWRRQSGRVDRRTVREADLFELGPVVFPAYSDTSVGVRSRRRPARRETYDEFLIRTGRTARPMTLAG